MIQYQSPPVNPCAGDRACVRPPSLGRLGDDEGRLHACTTVRLTVVAVCSRGVEGHGEGGALLPELVAHGDLLLVNSGGDVVLIEDDVVGSSLVVGPASKG